RQPVLHARYAAPLRYGRIEQIVVVDRTERFPIAGSKSGDRVVIQTKFENRPQDEALDPTDRTLSIGGEGPNGLDLVAEEIDAHGPGKARRKQIDDATPAGNL